jgi:pimeloyl-ACP methyl ester carboxylesterase
MTVNKAATFLSSFQPTSVFLLLSIGFAFLPATSGAENTIATLSLTDANKRAVQGVVCDNLPDTPQSERSALYAELPAGWQAADVEYSLSNPDGSRTDDLGNPNVGQIEWQEGGQRLRYLPPLEFNLQQMPDEKSVYRPAFPITSDRSRRVRLAIVDRATHGKELCLASEIVLMRPTVVLVHGINSDPSVWFGAQRDGVGATLAANGFSLAALDSSGEFGKRNRQRHRLAASPQIYFDGNGPVEYFAQNLGRLIQSCLQQTREGGLVAHRVDIVAHSYGSVVARWFLKTITDKAPGSRHWYVNSTNDPRGANLYTLPAWFWNGETPPDVEPSTRAPHGGVPVRKLITIAGIWRGVPLCNYLNEIQGPAHDKALGGRRFSQAPLAGYPKLFAPNLGQFVERRLQKKLPTRVPSMEVMAVNSRWMQWLNARPFCDGVAYGSIAGDDSRVLTVGKLLDLDPYTTISHYQQPSWFPDLQLERYNKGLHNISDGVVPLWSATIAGSNEVVEAHHLNILRNQDTKTYVLAALSCGMLPRGDKLKSMWDDAVIARVWNAEQERFRYWDFDSGKMAPEPQNNDYQLVEPSGVLAREHQDTNSAAVARIAPRALAPLSPQ